MNFDELLNINWSAISVLFSALAFIGILFTLLEMKKQRKYSYKPYLMLNETFIKIKNDNYLKPFIWQNGAENYESDYNMFFYLELKNIGLATAKNITLIWEMDKNEIDRRFNRQIDKYGLTDRVEHKNRISYKYLDYGFILEEIEEEKIPFLSSEKSVNVKLTDSLKSYLSFYPIILCKEKNEFRYLFKEVVPVKLFLNYQDISNKNIKKIFEIEADLYVETKKLKEEDAVVTSGKINIIEI